MKINEITHNKTDKLVNLFRDLLIICQEELELEHLPKIVWLSNKIVNGEYHSFGSFNPHNDEIQVAITGRHPIDIMRTLAHELVHYRQRLDGRIKHDSGRTGSDIENEAHAVAGVIMRRFDNMHPEAFSFRPIMEDKKTKKKEKTIDIKPAVTDLENKLLATNTRKHTYQEIDDLMKSIAKENKITAKQLHDAFKKKHGVIPDEWIEYQEVGE
jgi:hypothetical protein